MARVYTCLLTLLFFTPLVFSSQQVDNVIARNVGERSAIFFQFKAPLRLSTSKGNFKLDSVVLRSTTNKLRVPVALNCDQATKQCEGSLELSKDFVQGSFLDFHRSSEHPLIDTVTSNRVNLWELKVEN